VQTLKLRKPPAKKITAERAGRSLTDSQHRVNIEIKTNGMRDPAGVAVDAGCGESPDLLRSEGLRRNGA
jgi:hypothetical protein